MSLPSSVDVKHSSAARKPGRLRASNTRLWSAPGGVSTHAADAAISAAAEHAAASTYDAWPPSDANGDDGTRHQLAGPNAPSAANPPATAARLHARLWTNATDAYGCSRAQR